MRSDFACMGRLVRLFRSRTWLVGCIMPIAAVLALPCAAASGGEEHAAAERALRRAQFEAQRAEQQARRAERERARQQQELEAQARRQQQPQAGDANAQAERQRVETERRRVEAERLRAEGDRQRADSERQRGEFERQRAEEARQRSDAERLRAEFERQRVVTEQQRRETERLRQLQQAADRLRQEQQQRQTQSEDSRRQEQRSAFERLRQEQQQRQAQPEDSGRQEQRSAFERWRPDAFSNRGNPGEQRRGSEDESRQQAHWGDNDNTGDRDGRGVRRAWDRDRHTGDDENGQRNRWGSGEDGWRSRSLEDRWRERVEAWRERLKDLKESKETKPAETVQKASPNTGAVVTVAPVQLPTVKTLTPAPPATVPKQESVVESAHQTAATTSTTKKAEDTKDKAKPADNAKAGDTAKSGKGGLVVDAFAEVERRVQKELVAVGLDEAEVQSAKTLGFSVDSATALPGSGEKVFRFRVPDGMSRDAARRVLAQRLPLARFSPNQAYRIFDATAGGGPRAAAPTSSGEPANAQVPAQPERPAAPVGPLNPAPAGVTSGVVSELIQWTPELSACTRGVKVGVIDTSFDGSHPALRHLRPKSETFLEGEAPSPYDWHGTAVLSLLAGDPKSATPGLIPGAQYFLATAFRSDENGTASTDSVRLVAALAWLEKEGVEYVNMSFSGPRDALFEAAVQRMRRKGVVFVAAAGNQGPNAPPSYPAAYADVIAVTAVNSKGESYRHANRGSYIDFSAPGVDIVTALPGGGKGARTGTSFAAPFVTAMVATRLSADTRSKPELLKELGFEDLGPPGPDPIYGRGLALAPKECAAPAAALSLSTPHVTKVMAAPMGVGAR